MTNSRITSPVKQREYWCSDGRKRIIPEAVGLAVGRENISGDAQYQAIDFYLKSSNHRRMIMVWCSLMVALENALI